MDLVTVAEFPNSAEAFVAKNLLEAEGIRAFVEDTETGDLFDVAAPFGDVKVQVADTDLEQARAVLEAVRRHELASEVEKEADEAAGTPPEDEAAEPA